MDKYSASFGDVELGYVTVSVFDTEEQMVVPAIDEMQLGRVWGTVGITAQGGPVLDLAVSKYLDPLEQAVISGDPNAPSTIKGLTRVAQVSGFTEGAIDCGYALQGQHQDAMFQQSVDNISFIIDIAPIPGISDIGPVKEYLAEAGTKFAFDASMGIVKSTAVDGIRSNWGDAYTDALATAAAEDRAADGAYGDALHGILDSHDPVLMEGIGARERLPGESQWDYQRYLDADVDDFIRDLQGDRNAAYDSGSRGSNQEEFNATHP